jgi:hypothetical protein
VQFATQMDNFGALNEQLWAEIQRIVQHNDLDEPFASQLRQKLSLDESDIYPKYRNWILAAREEVAAVTHYLDVNEHYLGQFKWHDNSLTFTNPRVPGDIAKAQAALAAADDHYSLTGRAALQNHGNTVTFVLAAMRDLEKGMTRHESAYEEGQPERKLP